MTERVHAGTYRANPLFTEDHLSLSRSRLQGSFNTHGYLIVGVEGVVLMPRDIQRLSDPNVCGVILFSRNYQTPEQLKALTDDIHAIRTPQLTLYVDHEGGRVQRFKEGFTVLPSLLEYGRLYETLPRLATQRAYEHGVTLASELLRVGVDVSFAPVVDLYHPASKIIGARAFHENPDVVIELASAMIRGLHTAGMPAILKHFPGHGNLVGDTHVEAVIDEDVTHTEAYLRAVDVKPFAALISEVEGIMVAHTRHMAVDPDHIASQSSRWIQTILRGELGFQGKIFSDDLSMEASKTGSFDAVCAKTKAAGCDFLIAGQWDMV